MALKQSMELQIDGKTVAREELQEFLELVPAHGTITTVVSRISGDRNISDTYKVKLRAECAAGKAE